MWAELATNMKRRNMENEVQMLLFSLPHVPLMSVLYLEENPGSQLGIGNLQMDDTSRTLVKKSAV